ncbi:MAG: hypothetical protein A2X86_19145 [Bdellovibrionales bacterium GWA2_49_15]|nr:MAG: hypothetical protein A2X86_19145 [Bdellovibrionales bacterium GWA2_49_15]HAZ14344.1 hypothetical protein [Bdellovibrionales bacterium]
MRSVAKIIAFLSLIIMESAFGRSIPKFASAHSVLLDGGIEEGVIFSRSQNPSVLVAEINEQLMYSIGQLNGLGGGVPDMAKTKITLGNILLPESGVYRVTYRAAMKIAWPIEKPFPKSYELVLPKQGSEYFLERFFKQYGSDERGGKKCLAAEVHNVELGNFWYYYRPLQRTCGLRLFPASVTKVSVSLSYGSENTKGKSPEYDKVWEDGKVVATLLFGMADAEENSPFDAGIMAFQQTVQEAFANYGEPTWSNVANLTADFLPSNDNAVLHMKFALSQGQLDLVLVLVEDIKEVYPGSEIEKLYNERTAYSDFVSYSGHSGLGANIRKLAQMGSFVPEQYQIFLINGCDTFAYVDEALARAHERMNPGQGRYKYFDILTNAMPSFFHMNARSNMAVISALVGKVKTYQEILAGFDRNQRAVVTGEEDNNWPAPF